MAWYLVKNRDNFTVVRIRGTALRHGGNFTNIGGCLVEWCDAYRDGTLVPRSCAPPLCRAQGNAVQEAVLVCFKIVTHHLFRWGEGNTAVPSLAEVLNGCLQNSSTSLYC
jgi:hypothetical protein